MLTREKLLAAQELRPTETINIPELGGDVTLQGLTAKEWIEFQKKPNEDTFAFKLVVLSLKNGTGERLLTNDDLPLIEALPGRVFQQLIEVAMRLNGFGRTLESPLAESNGSSSA